MGLTFSHQMGDKAQGVVVGGVQDRDIASGGDNEGVIQHHVGTPQLAEDERRHSDDECKFIVYLSEIILTNYISSVFTDAVTNC